MAVGEKGSRLGGQGPDGCRWRRAGRDSVRGDALRFGDVVLRAQKMPLGLMGSGWWIVVGTALQCSSSDGPGLSGSCSGRAGVESVDDSSGREDGRRLGCPRT